jgi:hypothetical protein
MNSSRVAAFLPDGGTPASLDRDYTNKTETPAGVLGSQVLALRLNVAYSCSCVYFDLGLTDWCGCYGDFTIPASCGSFAGMTVDAFLAIADSVVGGSPGALARYRPSDVNYTASCLNELFDGCYPITYALVTMSSPPPDLSNLGSQVEPAKALPEEFSVSQNRPNPMDKSTAIHFALPKATKVTLEIFDIRGRTVKTLLNAHRAPGYHTVMWTGDDNHGKEVSSGVYFYRARLGDELTVMKKMVKLD